MFHWPPNSLPEERKKSRVNIKILHLLPPPFFWTLYWKWQVLIHAGMAIFLLTFGLLVICLVILFLHLTCSFLVLLRSLETLMNIDCWLPTAQHSSNVSTHLASHWNLIVFWSIFLIFKVSYFSTIQWYYTIYFDNDLSQEWTNLFIKLQITNVLGFVSHMVPVTTTQCCHCNVQAAIDNI